MKKTAQPRLSNITRIVLITIVSASIAFAQSGTTSPDRGVKLGNAYAAGDFETINNTNGNLMLKFPLATLPAGRGSATAGFSLTYSSKLYNMRSDKRADQFHDLVYYDRTVIEADYKGGWRRSHGGYSLEEETRFGSYIPNCSWLPSELNQQIVYSQKLKVVFPDGSAHEMIPYGYKDVLGDRYFNIAPDGMVNSCQGMPTYHARPVYYSRDGSFLRLETQSSTSWTLYFADGSKVVNGDTIYDKNGNYVQGLTDQFGRSIGSGTSNGYELITSKGVGGEDITWKIKWKTIYVFKTYAACDSNHTHCHDDQTFYAYPRDHLWVSFDVVEEIIQPDALGGGTYKFTYNGSDTPPQIPGPTTYGWGELSGVELPSGTKITYTYSMDGQDGPEMVEQTKQILKSQVVSKTVKYDLEYDGQTIDDGAVEVWGYGAGPEGSSVAAPDGSVTETWFATTEPTVDGYLPWDSGLTRKVVSPDGTKVENLWERNIPTGCHGASTCPSVAHADNPYIKATFTSIKEGGVYAWTAIKAFTYDMNGNLTEVREYDYVPHGMIDRPNGYPTSVPAAAEAYLKRVTKTEFWNQAPTAQSTAPTPPTSYDDNIYIFGSPSKLLNLPKSVEVQDQSGATKSRSEMDYDYEVRVQGIAKAGNLTLTRVWDSTKLATYTPSTVLDDTNSIKTQATYNTYGMPLTTTDPNNVVTQITYGPITTPTGSVSDLYATQKIQAYGTGVARTSSAVYDFSTGVVTSATDDDNDVTTVTEYDALGRPKKVKNASGVTGFESWTQTEYHDAARRIIVKTDLETLGDGRKVAIQHFDQQGRVRLARTLENASAEDPTNEQHGIKVQTRYGYHSGSPSNSNGEYTLVSNAYRAATSSAASSEPTMGWKVAFDSKSGNFNAVEFFSGSGLPSIWGTNANSTGKSEVVEDSNATTTTDETGKVRRTIVDGLGRLIRVDEPDLNGALGPVGSPSQATSYSHDALGNLLQIVQGGQTRTYTYSSLSRLTSATNPESGTVQFGYDSNGNLTTKTDARNITTTFVHDALNRVKQSDYSDATPDITYTYDENQVPFSKGKLTRVASTVSESRITAYDAQERVAASQQITDGETYNFAYTYNLDDDLVTQTYPSAKLVRFAYDSSGDLTQVKRETASGLFVYANSFAYMPHGQVERLRLGNGKWESTAFNSRMQITQTGLGHSAADTGLWRVNYDYGDWDGLTLNAQKNNGSLARQTITVPTVGAITGFTAVQTYSYDSLDRLKSATETIGGNQTWKQTFLFDRFGNKNFDTGNTTIQSTESAIAKITNPEILPANNQFKQDQDGDGQPDYLFDASGNVTKNARSQDFTYDAENRQITATGASLSIQHFYDGNGKRVKSHSAVTNQTTIFVHDAEGKLAAEYTVNVSPPAIPVISYLTEDAIGSVRVTTNSFAEIKSRRDFLPFGEELLAGLAGRNASQKYSSNSDDTRKKFATYQRDSETDLDWAQSRYYSPMHGRFTSPDEFKGGPDELFDFEEDASDNPTFYADLTNPQSLNKYQYGYNNPYKFNDPTGHCPPLIGVVVAACLFILSNPTEIGPRREKSTGEVVADIIGILPPGRVAGGPLVRVFLGQGTRTTARTVTRTTTEATTKAATKNIVKPTTRYKRPNNATTRAQRKSVQNKPCVDCGKRTSRQVANHKRPLVKEHYETGKIDRKKMRDVKSVNSQCPTCSARQGAEMSRYSREMKKKLGEQ